MKQTLLAARLLFYRYGVCFGPWACFLQELLNFCELFTGLSKCYCIDKEASVVILRDWWIWTGTGEGVFKSVPGYDPGQVPAVWFWLLCCLVFCFCWLFFFPPKGFVCFLFLKILLNNDLLSTMTVLECTELGKVGFAHKTPKQS